MTNRASDVAARLGRSLGATPSGAAPEPTDPPTPAVSPTPAPKAARAWERFTVDMTPDLNDALQQWAHQAKASVGRRVPKTEVVRVLVELLLEDTSLAAQVKERLEHRF